MTLLALQEAALATVNWAAIGVVVTVVSIVISSSVTLAVLYLKMFIKGELATMKAELMGQIELKFPQKVVFDMQMKEHERRLTQIEITMEQIRVQKNHDDAR